MNWNEVGTQIILWVLGIIFSGLGAFVTYLINKYVKNNNAKNILNSLLTLVKNCVLEIRQTYVDDLKKQGRFDVEAQKKALEKCYQKVITTMPKEMEKWLKDNYSDIEAFIKGLIESQIGLIKAGIN